MTREQFEYARSARGIEETKEFFRRSGELEKEAVLLHARMDQLRKRKALLSEDGAACAEKEALLSCMAETEKQILAEYRSLLQTENEIRQLIGRVPQQNYRMVLEMHYLQHFTFLSLAEKMHMDERHIYRVFKKAVEMAALYRMDG